MKKSDLDTLNLPAPIELQADDLAAIAGASGIGNAVQTAIMNARLARIGVPVFDKIAALGELTVAH